MTMARLTQMICYLNSDSKDWNKQPVKITSSDFTHYNITVKAKSIRRNIKYGYHKMNKSE